jgi:DNA-binding NarL/FixJ family response regulator
VELARQHRMAHECTLETMGMAKTGIKKTAKALRVFIVDDHPIVREGLAAQIGLQSDLELCGEAEDVAGALAQIESARPDVAIIDISLKSGNGIDLIKRLRTRDQALRILVWSMYPEHLYAERALRAGAQGYVNKGQSTREIFNALRTVMAGKVYVSAALGEQLMKRLIGGKTAERSPIDTLSDRELETFELLGQGLTTEEIAAKMHVSPKTVETHRVHIKKKLNVESIPELVQRAAQWLLQKG